MTTETIAEIDSKPPLERLAFKPHEAAAVLGVSRNRVFELLATGDIASVRYGRTRLIPRQAIERFLKVDEAA